MQVRTLDFSAWLCQGNQLTHTHFCLIRPHFLSICQYHVVGQRIQPDLLVGGSTKCILKRSGSISGADLDAEAGYKGASALPFATENVSKAVKNTEDHG